MTKPSQSAMIRKTTPESWASNPISYARQATVAFLKGLFAELPAGNYHWSSDPKQTEIFISADAPYKAQALGQRPAITCGRGSAGFQQMFIDDLGKENWMNQTETRTDMISMMISIICLADNELEAEELAWFCTNHIFALRHYMVRQGFHEFGRGLRMEPATAAGQLVTGEGAVQWRRVQILVPTHYQNTVKTQPEIRVPLAGVIMNMEANLGRISEVTRSSVGIVGTGLGRVSTTDPSGFEVPRQGLVAGENVEYEKKTPAAPEPALSIRVEA